MRKQHDLIQGSDAWHAFRYEHGGASEAAAMLGLSTLMPRNELLHLKSTGFSKEFGDYVQRMILDKGHEVEALARPIAEAFISEDLFPVTMSDGYMSASCDGLTLDESIAWECKQFNAKLFVSVQNGELPEQHWPQCQQVLYVTEAEKLIFTCSDGTLERTAHMTVYPDNSAFEKLDAGWNQFQLDLAAFEPVETVAAPVADAIMQLPAINVQVTGGLTVSNLKEVIVQFDDFIDNANVVLVTVDDFGNANATAKFSREQAKKLKACRHQIIDQVADISEATRIIDLYADKFDALGLKLEKLVKTETENRKLQILNAAKIAFTTHCGMLEKAIAPVRLIVTQPNFAEEMKGKRTIAGWQNAVDSALANGKIEADAIARNVRSNIDLIDRFPNHKFLFNDLQQIIYKSFDDLKLLIESRIMTHDQAEAGKLEAQRLQIQAEEEAKARRKAEAEQAQTLEAERAQVRAEEQARITEERRLEQIEFDKKQEAEKLAAQELRDQKAPDLDAGNELVRIEEKPIGVTVPTRLQLIEALAFMFNVNLAVAEQWLVDAFFIEFL